MLKYEDLLMCRNIQQPLRRLSPNRRQGQGGDKPYKEKKLIFLKQILWLAGSQQGWAEASCWPQFPLLSTYSVAESQTADGHKVHSQAVVLLILTNFPRRLGPTCLTCNLLYLPDSGSCRRQILCLGSKLREIFFVNTLKLFDSSLTSFISFHSSPDKINKLPISTWKVSQHH